MKCCTIGYPNNRDVRLLLSLVLPTHRKWRISASIRLRPRRHTLKTKLSANHAMPHSRINHTVPLMPSLRSVDRPNRNDRIITGVKQALYQAAVCLCAVMLTIYNYIVKLSLTLRSTDHLAAST